jgi:DNA polymerase V
MPEELVALIDCNSFYCSCERLFRPELARKPVIVLSNNDGCAVSRSDEAKLIGIKMGAPYFKIKDLCHKYSVSVFSSNYALYGDLSARVMSTIASLVPEIEVYSIDEAFVTLPPFHPSELTSSTLEMKNVITQNTGIPVSIGVGSTKVLSKVANHLAKQNKVLTNGVYALVDPHEIESELKNFPVRDVWGIGHQSSRKLADYGIKTANDLRNANDKFIKKLLSIVGLNIARELRGEKCLSLENAEADRKQVMSTRSFGKPVHDLNELKESVATHISIATQKLRHQNLITRYMRVMLLTDRFSSRDYYYSKSTTLAVGSSSTSRLISIAESLVEQLYKPGLKYKKAGVLFGDLISANNLQTDIFSSQDAERETQLMKTLDHVNSVYGKGTLKVAACGTRKAWKMQSQLKSPAYTTRWSELAVIKK